MGARTRRRIARLRDIITEEVSFVDRAANRRRFLVCKREQPAVGEAPALVEVENEAPVPSAAGVKLQRALEAFREAVTEFEAEAQPLAILSGELLDEVKELSARLAGGASQGPAPQDGNAMGSNQETEVGKAGPVEAALREVSERSMSLANALKDAGDSGVDEAKMSGEVGKLAELLSALREKYPSSEAGVQKKGVGSKMLREVAERALSLSSKLSKGPVDRKGVSEIKRLAAMLAGLVERYPSVQAKAEGEQPPDLDALLTRAEQGEEGAAEAVVEMLTHQDATEAVTTLKTEADAKLTEIEEAEKPKEPAPEATPPAQPDPSAEIAKLAAVVSKQAEQNKALGEEIRTLRTSLAKAISTPEEPASREVREEPKGGTGADPDKDPTLFPTNYNDPANREERKRRGFAI